MLRAKVGKHFMQRLAGSLAALLLTAASAPTTYSGQPIIWETGGRAELLKGDARGVSISDTGVLMLAPRLTEVFNTEQAFVWSSAVDAQGNVYLGTGHDGKIYRITPDGHGEVFFDPGDKYIWSLAVLADGSLAVGTGDNGKLYRVRAAGAKPESSLLIATNQTHVMSLAVTAQGDLIAGTDPGGLVLRISPEGKAFALFDAHL